MFVTNVRLSADDNVGGIDQLKKFIKSAALNCSSWPQTQCTG
jgi:hypothetical protein